MTRVRQDPKEEAKRLLGYLRQLKDDRGAMADLRCALIPARLPRAWPLLARVGGIDDCVLQTVAGLFAYHPVETDAGNIGSTCHKLAEENNSFEDRFRRLLSCQHRDEICERLRPVILAAKAKRVAINYERLPVDLRRWSDRVKARWAEQFWGVQETQPAAGPEAIG